MLAHRRLRDLIEPVGSDVAFRKPSHLEAERVGVSIVFVVHQPLDLERLQQPFDGRSMQACGPGQIHHAGHAAWHGIQGTQHGQTP